MDCVDEKLIELATEGRISCACAMKFYFCYAAVTKNSFSGLLSSKD